MRSVFALVEAPLLLLLLLIFVGPVPHGLVIAFPTGTTPYTVDSNSETTATAIPPHSNETLILVPLSGAGTATDRTGELTEYPVFISVPEEETQTVSPEESLSDSVSSSSTPQPPPVVVADGGDSADGDVDVDADDAVTEGYMVIEDQEVDEDDDDDNNDGSDSSTVSSAIVRTTLPMQSPKSSREQEEVLRELKKLFDISEGLKEDGGEDQGLKSSISSIVYLAYARVYSESDETLQKLKYLLQKLQARILGTETNGYDHDHDERFSTKLSAKPDHPLTVSSTTLAPSQLTSEPNYSQTITDNADRTNSPKNLVTGTTTTISPNNETTGSYNHPHIHDRQRRSYYDDGRNDVESIFFANFNSEENSVIPDEEKKEDQKLKLNQSRDDHDDQNEIHPKNGLEMRKKLDIVADSMATGLTSQMKNDSDDDRSVGDPLDKKMLKVGAISSSTKSSSTTVMSVTTREEETTPSPLVQKVIRINDRRKPMPSFYLSPERIQELKNRMKTTTTLRTTLSPISIAIQDEVENEVNSLQQQGQVDNYDVHISENFPSLSTTISPSSYHKKRPGLTTMSSLSLSTVTATKSPYTAEEIALALFQLLRPNSLHHENNELGEQVKVTPLSRPPPSTTLYQVGALNQRLNFTLSNSNPTTTSAPVKMTQSTTASTTTMTTTTEASTTPPSTTTTRATTTRTTTSSTIAPSVLSSVLKLKDFLKTNSTPLLDLPPALSNLDKVFATTSRTRPTPSTERYHPNQNIYQNDAYDDYDDPTPRPPPATLIDGIREGILQTVQALMRLSVGAKIVLLFCISISLLSIGFGLYAIGPPLAGVGILGIIIPSALLLLFETAVQPAMSGNRRLDLRRREEELIEKVQSEEFSKILDSIFDAVIKYGKEGRRIQF